MSTNAEGNHESGPPPLSEEERTKLLNEMLERHATQLSEHFSSVQILATRLEADGGTRLFDRGSGDFFARLGAIRRWFKQHDLPGGGAE